MCTVWIWLLLLNVRPRVIGMSNESVSITAHLVRVLVRCRLLHLLFSRSRLADRQVGLRSPLPPATANSSTLDNPTTPKTPEKSIRSTHHQFGGALPKVEASGPRPDASTTARRHCSGVEAPHNRAEAVNDMSESTAEPEPGLSSPLWLSLPPPVQEIMSLGRAFA
ncbi:hypothetical protein HYQ46_002138 [Verticillium longisporum]|nr:hypothetical protein HYQ46_002138 [Verticillium longisporum]